jgi:hypothetical protein
MGVKEGIAGRDTGGKRGCSSLTITQIERFLERTKRVGGCLVFIANSKQKYPRFNHLLAHRVGYELLGGKNITKGMTLDHLCLNKECVEPSHLEEVTAAENSKRYSIYRKTGDYPIKIKPLTANI